MKRRTVFSLAGLCVIGIASGALWWCEVQLHGWTGLIWLEYFHWAIPAGVAGCLAWLYFECGIVGRWKHPAFILCMAILLAVLYEVTHRSLVDHFNYWNWESFDPPWWQQSRNSILLVFPLIPILLWSLSMLFGLRFRIPGVLAGFAIYYGSVSLAIACIHITGYQGYPDPIHAIKTGFIAPFLIVGIGLPYVFKANGSETQSSYAPDPDDIVAGDA